MARVDPDDDTITRYIVHHYRFDPLRHERRHVVIAAFDNELEFEACMEVASSEIAQRRKRGDDVHPHEHISGGIHEPGYHRRATNGRLISRAIAHGVFPDRLAGLELPQNVAISQARGPE